MKEALLKYLSERNVHPGETVQLGWLIFFVIENERKLDLETLDFQSMASFTRDFTVAEDINRRQIELLETEGVEPVMCHLRQFAVLSKSYVPGTLNAFISRDFESEGNDSGWYVGIVDDPLDINNSANLIKQSLYEISINDGRFLPYWLLPAGYRIIFEGPNPQIDKPNQAEAPA